jgi:hypothetical protein
VAKFKAEFIEIARRLILRRVPFPPGYIARGNGVRLQDQRLAPKSVVSTTAVRIIHGGALAADRNQARHRRARGQDAETRYNYFLHKPTPLGLTFLRQVRAIRNFKTTSVTCQTELEAPFSDNDYVLGARRSRVKSKTIRPAGGANPRQPRTGYR